MDENLQGVGRVDILMSWYLKFKLLNSGRIAKVAYKRKKNSWGEKRYILYLLKSKDHLYSKNWVLASVFLKISIFSILSRVWKVAAVGLTEIYLLHQRFHGTGKPVEKPEKIPSVSRAQNVVYFQWAALDAVVFWH